MAQSRHRITIFARTTLAIVVVGLVSATMLNGAPQAAAGTLNLSDPNLTVLAPGTDPVYADILLLEKAQFAKFPATAPSGPDNLIPEYQGPFNATVEAHRRADGSLNPNDLPTSYGLTETQLQMARLANSAPNVALAMGQNEGVPRAGVRSTLNDSYDLIAWVTYLRQVQASGGTIKLVQDNGYVLNATDLSNAITYSLNIVAAQKWIYNQRWLSRWAMLRSAGLSSVADAEQAEGLLVKVDYVPGRAVPAATDCDAYYAPAASVNTNVPGRPAGMTCTALPQPAGGAFIGAQGTYGSGAICNGPGGYTVCDSSQPAEVYSGARTSFVPSANPVPTATPKASHTPAVTPTPARTTAPGGTTLTGTPTPTPTPALTGPAGGTTTAAPVSLARLQKLQVTYGKLLAATQKSLPVYEAMLSAGRSPAMTSALQRLISSASSRISAYQAKIADLTAQITAAGG